MKTRRRRLPQQDDPTRAAIIRLLETGDPLDVPRGVNVLRIWLLYKNPLQLEREWRTHRTEILARWKREKRRGKPCAFKEFKTDGKKE